MTSWRKIWTVDVFTLKSYEGNPAGVMILEEFLEPTIMQSVASEMNLSETAFVVPCGPSSYAIRWFTPKEEAPFCVHATLGAAHILWSENMEPTDSLVFESQAGFLPVFKNKNSAQMTITLPLQPLPEDLDPPSALEDILGIPIQKVYFGNTRSRDVTQTTTSPPWLTSHYLVEVSCEEDLRRCRPHLEQLAQLECRALTLTAPSTEPFDFISRYFAPRVGIPEDPFCGSAHCRLAPLWAKKLNKSLLRAHSGSARGGSVLLKCTPNDLTLTASAVTTLEGHLHLPYG